jgi:hypothetical protein
VILFESGVKFKKQYLYWKLALPNINLYPQCHLTRWLWDARLGGAKLTWHPMCKRVASSVKCLLRHSVFRIMRTQKTFYLLHTLNPIVFFCRNINSSLFTGSTTELLQPLRKRLLKDTVSDVVAVACLLAICYRLLAIWSCCMYFSAFVYFVLCSAALYSQIDSASRIRRTWTTL